MIIMRKICKIKFSKINWYQFSKYENICLGIGQSVGELGIPSIDHYECRRLFILTNCVTWLYSTLFFNKTMHDSDDECQVIHSFVTTVPISARNAWHYDPSSADSAFLEDPVKQASYCPRRVLAQRPKPEEALIGPPAYKECEILV